MKTIFVNAVKARVGPTEVILELGSFFAEQKPGEPAPTVPPEDLEYDVRIVMPLPVADHVGRAILKSVQMAPVQQPSEVITKVEQ